jgi:hypothetical protein
MRCFDEILSMLKEIRCERRPICRYKTLPLVCSHCGKAAAIHMHVSSHFHSAVKQQKSSKTDDSVLLEKMYVHDSIMA